MRPEDGGITVDFWIVKVQLKFPLDHRIPCYHRITLDHKSPHFYLKLPLNYQKLGIGDTDPF